MILSIRLLCKKEDMKMEDFREHWLKKHGPLVTKIPAVRAYHQNHVLSAQAFDIPTGGKVIDGIDMVWFDDKEAMEKCFASEEYQALIADEANFVGEITLFIAEQNKITPVNQDKKLIKRMSLITRHPNLDFDKYKYEWYVVHADFVLKMAEVEGYNQNLILDRFSERGQAASREEIAIDGIVELWFENEDALNKAFSSPNGERAKLHTRTLLSDVTPFLVQPYELM